MFNLIPWRRKENTALQRDDHPLSRMRNEFEALFERFFNGWPESFLQSWETQPFWGVDLDETDKELTVRFEAPGFEASDFDVQIGGNLLTVSAEHKQEFTDEERPARSERRFQRSVTLSADTDVAKAVANYRNGVLELRLPKTEATQAKRIAVQSS